MHPGTGIIRTTYNVDLESSPSLNQTCLLEVTYDPVHKYQYLFHAKGVGILTANCEDVDTPRQPLTYSIVGGNTNNRFTMDGAQLVSRAQFSYELLVRVQDQGMPVCPTTATVNVVPWTSTRPTTTTTTTTTTIKSVQAEMVTLRVLEWRPQPWFVAILTITGALLMGSLGLLLWKLDDGKGDLGQAEEDPEEEEDLEEYPFTTFRNTNNRFTMDGAQLVSRAQFSYELLVRVQDQGMPVCPTTATVNVVPWTSTRPTTTTTTTTTIKSVQAEMVTLRVLEWRPQPWFVAVLTITGALLMGSLGLLLWKLDDGKGDLGQAEEDPEEEEDLEEYPFTTFSMTSNCQ
ncbi:hypothetical protein J4Q44_G00107760 [Coregonus suidteri]|uniref:Uncharacterized protein n=1 Tax=Coregonus suidteri TaxID=861788 RepID=A0AAN8QWS2_9TELE